MPTSNSIKERIAKANPAMMSIKTRYEAEGCQPVALRDEVYALLAEHDLGGTQIIHCKHVGTHPWNRGRSLVDPDECLNNKLPKFKRGGFSFLEMRRAAALERPHGKKGNEYEESNKKCANASNGMLAKVTTDSLKIFSLTCGHTNQSMRCAWFEVPCDNPDISIQGKVSAAKIGCKTFSAALTDGVPWFVILAPVEEQWPWVIELIIEADNVPMTVAKQDSRIQIMWRIHSKALLFHSQKPELELDWKSIETAVLRSEPQQRDSIPDLVNYVRNWSGGLNDPFLLADLDLYIKGLSNIREIPSSVIGKLGTLDLGVLVGGRFRTACLKALAVSSDHKNGESTYLRSSDVVAMGSKWKPFVLQADEIMKTARVVMNNIPESFQLALPMRALLLGNLDVRLVSHVVQRPTAFGSYKTFHDIALAFISDLREQSSATINHWDDKYIKSPWKKTTVGPKNEADPLSRPIVDLGQAGKLSHVVALLKEKGIVLGTLCVPKSSPTGTVPPSYKVTKITPEHIVLNATIDSTEPSYVRSDHDKFFDEYRLADAPQDSENKSA